MSCERLIQRLTYDFPDVPEAVFQDHLVMAAQELACHEIFQLKVDLTADLQDCVQDYDFDHLIPPGMTSRSILSVEFCGCCIDPVDPKCNPCPHGYERCGINSIRLFPAPSAAEGQTLEICVALEPESDACEIPDAVCAQFQQALTNQVRSSILCLPNQPWSDFRASQKYEGMAKAQMRKRVSAYRDERTSQAQQVPGERWLV